MKFKHLEETGYTYRQHFFVSTMWSLRMFKLGSFAVVHAFLPNVFTTKVSESILEYAKEIKKSQED
ncbi:MAG: hypothetical protein CBB97_07135 [Candidatus Endolissoclinum sp. TMED37]|nr:MAG: hypothetical protein CBB97_07135 [Candidatus Endolissoclinum sp. TMED37]